MGVYNANLCKKLETVADRDGNGNADIICRQIQYRAITYMETAGKVHG